MKITDSIAYEYAKWCMDPENKKVGYLREVTKKDAYFSAK